MGHRKDTATRPTKNVYVRWLDHVDFMHRDPLDQLIDEHTAHGRPPRAFSQLDGGRTDGTLRPTATTEISARRRRRANRELGTPGSNDKTANGKTGSTHLYADRATKAEQLACRNRPSRPGWTPKRPTNAVGLRNGFGFVVPSKTTRSLPWEHHRHSIATPGKEAPCSSRRLDVESGHDNRQRSEQDNRYWILLRGYRSVPLP